MVVARGELAVGLVECRFFLFEVFDLPGQGGVGDHQACVQILGLGGETLVFSNELVPVKGVADRRGEFLAQPGFGDETENFPLVDGLHDRRQREHGGDQDARGVRTYFPGFDQEIQPHHFGHAVIGYDHGKVLTAEQLKRLERTGRRGHMMAVALKGLLEGAENDGLVVDDENARGMRIAGGLH